MSLQQLNRRLAQVGEAVPHAGRGAHEVARAKLERLLAEQELQPPAAHQEGLLDLPVAMRTEGGRRAAVMQFNRFHLTGLLAWLFWCVGHIYFLIGLRHRFVVAFVWFWDFITFQRGARLITDVPPQPRQPPNPASPYQTS